MDSRATTTLGAAVRPVGYRRPERFERMCGGCRRQPVTAAEIADLDTLWLVPALGDLPAAARYCRACAPTNGPIAEVACESCGEGPLLAGVLALGEDLTTTAAIDQWLEESGWRPAGPWCPDCLGHR